MSNFNSNMGGVGMSDSTPISNLPDGGNMSQSMHQQPQSNVYMPLNNHKNPFIDGQSNINGVPMVNTRTTNIGNSVGGAGGMSSTLDETIQYSLPSRDIPQQLERFTHDEQIKPSYIPRNSDIDEEDYIPEEMEKIRNRRRKREKQVRFQEDNLVDIQQPFILALIFFILQLPVVNNIIFKYLGSFGFAGLDGNLNIAGIFLKSIGFGLIVYGYKYLMAGDFL